MEAKLISPPSYVRFQIKRHVCASCTLSKAPCSSGNTSNNHQTAEHDALSITPNYYILSSALHLRTSKNNKTSNERKM